MSRSSRKRHIKAALVALIFVLSLIGAPGCSSREVPGEVVTEGSSGESWFSAEKREIGYSCFMPANIDDLYYHTMSDGEHISVPAVMSASVEDVYNNRIDLIAVDTDNGSVSVNAGYDELKDMMLENDIAIYGDYFNSNIMSFSFKGKDYIQIYNPSDYDSGYVHTCFYELSDTGEYEVSVEIDELEDPQTPLVTGSFRVGHLTMVTSSDSDGWIYDENTIVNTSLTICDEDGHTSQTDLDEFLGENPFMICDISGLDEDTILISYRMNMISDTLRKAVNISDIDSPELEDDSVIPECINDMDDIYTIPDGTVCMSNDEALYFLGEDGEAVKAVDYALSGYNMAGFRFMRLISREEDGSLVFLSNDMADYGSSYVSQNQVLSTVTLTPAEPDTRQVLRIGVTDIVQDSVGRAVVDFNNSNETYFARVEFIGRNQSDFISDMSYAEFPEDEYGTYLGILCNNTDIITDVLQNDPPDVFISSDILMNEPSADLFVDLNTYIDSENGLDRDEYFDNIFRLAETDGMLFHMPVTYYLSGIRKSLSGDEQVEYGGMTYQEYSDLTEEYGGWDPLQFYCTPDTYAEELMSVQYDLFVDRLHGTANFHNAAFYALMDYISGVELENPTLNVGGVNIVVIDVDMSENFNRLDYGNIGFVIDNYGIGGSSGDDVSWYGLPSYDGRGISAGALMTEAIPVNAADPEGAWEFIRFSVSEPAQTANMYSFGLPVNRASLQEGCDAAENEANTDLSEMIEHADCYYVTDIELRYICHQAIGAYLNGECDADEAADIIENYMLEIMGSSGR